MKKQTGAAKTVITEAILAQVKDVLEMAAKHKYQASKVYAAHNAVFGLNETPEVCASCNKKRGDALKRWYSDYLMGQVNETNAQENAVGQALTGTGENTANAAEGPNVITGVKPSENLGENGPNVSRETISDLQAIYDKYATKESSAESEAEDIVQILEAHADGLTEEEALTLSDRLAELTAETDFDEDTKGELADTIKPGAKDLNESNTIAGGLDSENLDENGPALLDLKNKKGEYFQATFESEDGVNGQLVDAQGASLKPGTYSTEMGDSYAVQPGGKATYKNDAI